MFFKHNSYDKALNYLGLIFGYANKNYNDYDANVYYTDGSASFTNTFSGMKEKQVEFMLNSGLMSIGKYLGADFSFAIGASYNMFDKQSAGIYFNEPDTYYLDDDFFNKRQKNYFMVQLAMRFSFGLCLGGKR